MAQTKQVKMTPAQEQVTKARDRDILVSAAAGSGKTWVLVQRILCRMEQERLDITKFLIVTFTKAAAAEMRERIGRGIQQRLHAAAQAPETKTQEVRFWSRQATLVYQAKISTIDSFCADIVKQYFMKLSIDPNYRIAEEAELSILQGQVMEELLEQEYGKADERFLHFVECYAPGRDDKRIEKLIQQLYEFQVAHPDPDAWIAKSVTRLQDGSYWCSAILQHCKELLSCAQQLVREAIEYAAEYDGGEKVQEALQSDLDYFSSLFKGCLEEDYEQVYRLIRAHERYATMRTKSMDQDAAQQLKEMRQRYKTMVQKQIEQRYFSLDWESMERDRQAVFPDMEVLLRLSAEFRKAYGEAKRQQSIADFADVEHAALSVLTERTPDGEFAPSEIADRLSEEYSEILIDEYQDSNYLQEAILSSFARDNMFMVGDMKQSIYRFRMARPELFVGKYKQFAEYTGPSQEERQVRIELDRNFRSCGNVLESINYIFFHLMQESIGGVTYDERAALKPGVEWETPEIQPENREDMPLAAQAYYCEHETELCLYDALGQSEPRANDEADDASGSLEQDLVRAEARMVAARIHAMMQPGHTMLVRDDSIKGEPSQQYRPITYRDIVILLRSPSGSATVFQEVLSDEGIPTFVESSKGYFSTPEIQTMLSYLKALNNGLDDISVTSVLRNFFGECSASELAEIVCDTGQQCQMGMLARVRAWCARKQSERERPALYDRLCRFLQQYDRYVALSQELSVGDLIPLIYEESGYLDYVSALPAGERRAANLRILAQKANAYERTNFRGLFQFVRYIEQIREYEVDFGEASVLSENDDVVRILSIHKSKGLEFPVVFVCQLGKQFNETDLRSDVLLHADLGVGPNVIDPELRTRHRTIMRDVLALHSRREMLGEELRVLYVALTRAKDKCILSASVRDWESYLPTISTSCDYAARYSARSFLQWILMALCHHPAMQAEYERLGRTPAHLDAHRYAATDIAFHRVTADALSRSGYAEQCRQTLTKEVFCRQAEKIPDSQVKALAQQLSAAYPFAMYTSQPGKYSVSQLKEHRLHLPAPASTQSRQAQADTESIFLPGVEGTEDARTAQAQPDELSGAQRGTYIHKFMELYDFCLGYMPAEYERICGALENRGMTQIRKVLTSEQVSHFFATRVAREMVQAAQTGRLYKEAQFVVGFPAAQVLRDLGREFSDSDNERILVQGIMDAYYENAQGDWVILDYKTDRVKQAQKLSNRYQTQLLYYRRTLEQLTGKKVDRCMIYSFYLEEELEVNV